MPDFLPFRGTRYHPGGDLSAETAPPYDVIDEEERAALEASTPRNAVRLILPRDDDGTDPYEHAAATFAAWRTAGLLRPDPVARFYGYRMRYHHDGEDRHTVGVLGALGLGDAEHPVLPHERTLHKAKSDRLALLRATRANLDPIWGLSLAEGLTALVPDGPVLATAVDEAGTVHEIVAIDDAATVDAISTKVAGAPVVLADGHHRYETACAYRAEAGPTPGADAIMTLVVELSDDELCVHPIHRLLHGLGATRVRDVLASSCTLVDAGPNTPEAVDALVHRMTAEDAMGVVDADGLALASPRDDVLAPLLADEPEAVRDLDATRFAVAVAPALGEAEVGYRADAQTCAGLVSKGAADAAVLLRPATVPQIRSAAFADVRMPQKTTFFYPKPRTGMVFRSLDD